MTESVYYTSTATRLGDVGIVWRYKDGGPTAVRIFLPDEDEVTHNLIRRSFPGVVRQSHKAMEQVMRSVRGLAEGRNVTFSEEKLDMLSCGQFQRRVLSQVMGIPKGRVSTYGRLAERSGAPKGARAVGNALAMNPYPLIIPCHRVIRSDGSLGGFGGGLQMKKELLLLEGISFDSNGKVVAKFLC